MRWSWTAILQSINEPLRISSGWKGRDDRFFVALTSSVCSCTFPRSQDDGTQASEMPHITSNFRDGNEDGFLDQGQRSFK